MPIRNLGLSRQLATLVAVLGMAAVLGAMAVAMVAYGVGDAGPQLVAIIASMGAALTALVGALKSTEAADTAAKSMRTSELTASQLASVSQQLSAHCGEICPSGRCPLRQASPFRELPV